MLLNYNFAKYDLRNFYCAIGSENYYGNYTLYLTTLAHKINVSRFLVKRKNHTYCE